MGKRSHQNKVNSLSRLLVYMLGHKPDGFGLVPDSNGFVTYRELLQAIHEEPGWHYVRKSHVNEVLLAKDRSLFQAEEYGIRVLERRWRIDFENTQPTPHKILFTPIRRRAHPLVMEKGLKSAEGRYLVLSTNEEMALRIGKRRDQRPVLLKISAAAAESEQVFFYPFGSLFLSPQIPARFISGPPVSKVFQELRRDVEAAKEKVRPTQHDFTPGTFHLDASRDPDLLRRARGKKQKGWKEDARKKRRIKRK